MNFGFIRVGAAIPRLRVANCEYNAGRIIELMHKAEELDIRILVFPELCISAYTCGDLFHQQTLLKSCEDQLSYICEQTRMLEVTAILGIPVYADNQLFNCAAVVHKGAVIGVVPKIYVPGYSEFYEERWFASGSKAVSSTISLCGQEVPFGSDLLFQAREDARICFGIEICEDLWVPMPPSGFQAIAGAAMIFNPSASNEVIGKHEYRRNLVKQQSGRCIAAYIYSSCGVDESTTDVAFGGYAMIAEDGGVLAESERFKREEQLIYSEIDLERLFNDRLKNTSFMEVELKKSFRRIIFDMASRKYEQLTRYIDPHPFVPSKTSERDERCSEIFNIQATALAKRFQHTGAKHAVIAISGGLDSTLALLVTAKAFDLLGKDRKDIVAITMPGFGTTNTTYNNAIELMKSIGASIKEIDIKPACLQHFKDIGHDPSVHDVAYENVQARERTQILMDMASEIGGMVIGTGDLSELALGWSTYNGDHMSMYGVNCGVPKTLVIYLVRWVADNVGDERTRKVLYSILDTPISPELVPPDAQGNIDQKTEDIIGPYELHDFFLYHMVRYGAPPEKIFFLAKQAFKDKYEDAVILKWLKNFVKRFFSQQFKRSCLPDGPKVGTISLSPRGDWRMPSDAEAAEWLKRINE